MDRRDFSATREHGASHPTHRGEGVIHRGQSRRSAPQSPIFEKLIDSQVVEGIH
jgi:hypothetical protein